MYNLFYGDIYIPFECLEALKDLITIQLSNDY